MNLTVDEMAKELIEKYKNVPVVDPLPRSVLSAYICLDELIKCEESHSNKEETKYYKQVKEAIIKHW